MHERIKSFLLNHGVPQAEIDQLEAMEGKAKEVVAMVITDGKEAAIAFIRSEYDKLKDKVLGVEAKRSASYQG